MNDTMGVVKDGPPLEWANEQRQSAEPRGCSFERALHPELTRLVAVTTVTKSDCHGRRT